MAPGRTRRGAREAPLRPPGPAGDAPSTPAACRGPRRCATLWKRRDEAAAGLDPTGQHRTSNGRLAQRESASFTPRRSLVRSQYRPPGQGPMPTSLKITVGAIPVVLLREFSCASPVDAGHLGSGSWATVCGRGSGSWATVVRVHWRHSVLVTGFSAFRSLRCGPSVVAVEGAGCAGGAGCGGAAVPGGAGGTRGGRLRYGGGPAVRRCEADGARVAAPVCGGRAGRAGGPVAAAGVVPASDAGAGGGADRGDAAGASGVGAVADPVGAGTGRGGAVAGPLSGLPGAGAPWPGGGAEAAPAAGGLPAVGTRPVDGVVADGRDGPGLSRGRCRGEDRDQDR